MPGFLKQSTASQSRALGPFVDSTDFSTPETGLTIANTDIKLVVNGGASANKNSGGGTHRVNGVYGVTFDATDTATVGEMEVSVVVSGALPVFDKFFVVEEAVYDMLFGASALGYIANAPVNVAQFGGSNLTASSGIPAVNATQISGDSTAADNLETAYDDTAGAVPWTGVIDQGTAQSVSSSTIVLRSAAAFVDDALNGCTVVITNGTQVGERAIITDYVGATDTATVTWPGATPSGTPTYKVFGSAAGASLAEIATAVWQDSTSGDFTVASSIGKALYVSNVAPGGSGGHMISGSNSGTTTLAALTVSGATTLTGAVSATSASNDIVGIDVKKISGDATAADNLETMLDGTGGQNFTATFVGNQTGNLSGSVGSVSGAVGSVTGNVGGNVTGSIGSLAAQAKTDVNAEVLDVLVTDTFAEPSSVPAATASLKDKIGWQAALARNKITQTATTQLVRNDADNATIGTSTVSDDGTTATRGEFS